MWAGGFADPLLAVPQPDGECGFPLAPPSAAGYMKIMQPVTIYSTDYCPYCRAAKSLLDGKGVPYTEIDLSDRDAEREQLTARTGQRTVPQIFIGELHVGGFTDLDKLERQGKLDGLLHAG